MTNCRFPRKKLDVSSSSFKTGWAVIKPIYLFFVLYNLSMKSRGWLFVLERLFLGLMGGKAAVIALVPDGTNGLCNFSISAAPLHRLQSVTRMRGILFGAHLTLSTQRARNTICRVVAAA
jgi:hypothetical protein